jgi:elongation factor G
MNKKKVIKSSLSASMIDRLNQLRNIAIIAHIDAGKTTLTERIIYYANAKGKHKIGEVHDGSTTTDYLAQERERGITIVSAAVQFLWKNNIINLIDSPGHVDFTIEVERCLSVLEGAILVIDGSAGVQPQTECVWRQANKYKVSRLIFINKLDKEGANFYSSVESLQTRLSKLCIPIQIPYIENEKFTGIFDLLDAKLYLWHLRNHDYKVIELKDMTEQQVEMYNTARHNMIDYISNFNDNVLNIYLDQNDISNEELKKIIVHMCHTMNMYPVLCGSAFHNKGVQLLLDAVCNYIPNPRNSANAYQEMKSTISNEEVKIDAQHPNLSVFCFKWARDKHVGPISYCRIYSGHIKIGDSVYNSVKKQNIRIINVLSLFANKYESIKVASAGDIIGIVGQDINTGTVLSTDMEKLIMHKIDIPESIVHLAIKPKTEQDQDRFSKHIHDYMREDPTISFQYSEQRETILRGIGSLQLDILVSRMQTEKNINLEVFKPKVAYRTTVTSSYTHEYLHRKQTGGSGQFAKVVMVMEPYEDKEFCFVNEIKGGHVPEQYIPAVKASVIRTLSFGIFNCPVINIKVKLIDGDHHKVDSSDLAFQEATRICINYLLTKCEPILLEPYAKLIVYTPNEYADKIIGDVCSKGGLVINVDNDEFRDNYRVLTLNIAMVYTFDYIDNLRCISSGYASCMYSFSGYKATTSQPDLTT